MCSKANLYSKTLFVTDSVTPLDTIGLYLASDLIGPNPMKQMKLIDFRETLYESGQTAYFGRAGNFNVSISEAGVSIKNGSLTKFYLGNNIQQLSRKDIQFAFEKLSDTLHIPTEKAKVTKYHFARNIITNHPAQMYLDYFGPCLKYQKYPMPSGIYYKLKSSKNELYIYDKIKELKAKREYIPALYTGRNLLRLEDRVNTNPARYLKCSNLTGSDLYKEDIYTRVFKEWYHKFSNIQFLSDMQIDFSKINTKEQFKRAGVIALINSFGGPEKLLKTLDESRLKNEITRKQKGDLRKLILDQSKDALHTKIPDIMHELQEKIKQSARYYR
jgi:hypothetical protein